MTHRDDHPAGAPCWVETFQPDPRAALRFYGPLLGWTFDEATAMPDGLDGEYVTARVHGRRVAGIGQAPAASPAVWSVQVRVDDVDEALRRAEEAGGTRLTGPLDAGAEGRLAVLTDATGVAFSLWQARARAGAELVGAPGAWAMSSLHTTDLERARAFYGDLFGWRLEPVPGAAFSAWRLGDETVAVVTATNGVAIPPHWSVNFAVSDADATAAQATALGGSVLVSPVDAAGLRTTVIRDPQGAVIAISAPAR